MAAGNRIELKKVAFKPASDMAGAATELDRLDAEMQGVVDRYNARMLQRREQIQANLRDVPIPADAKVAAARTQMSRADHETRNEARPALADVMQRAGALHERVISSAPTTATSGRCCCARAWAPNSGPATSRPARGRRR